MDTIALKRTPLTLIYGVLLAVLFYPVVGSLAFWGHHDVNTTTLLTSRLFIWFQVAVLFLYAKKIEGNTLLLWPEKRYGFWFYPASVGALYLLNIGASIVSLVPRLFGLHDNEQIMIHAVAVVNKSTPLMLLTVVTAGATEELIFRGYLVPRLELIFKNKYMPVIVSSLVFALMHLRYLSLRELIFTFFIGVIFAIHYQWYRNIKVLIFTHALIDFLAFMLFRLAQTYHLH